MAHLDALGRTFLTEADNGEAGVYATRLALDIEGNALVVTDARENAAMLHTFGMGKRKLYQKSCDAGERWMLLDVAGQPFRAWDQRGFARRTEVDVLRRPTHHLVKEGAGDEVLVERVVYGEAHADAAALNLRGKVYRHYDGAGVVTTGAYDFKGNLLSSARRVAVAYATQVEWSALVGLTDLGDIEDAAESLLEAETFTTATAYDALNRPVSATTPDASEVRPTYNEAGLLEKVDVRIRGAVDWTSFVDDIDYGAKGQREKIVYGNGTETTYTYDPLTFRLSRLKTVRHNEDSTVSVLQNLSYTYDPVGNIVAIEDSAQQTVFFNNDVVSPSTQYVYDAIYRLVQASGREHAGGVGDVQRDQNDLPLMNLPHENDSAALRNYTDLYGYDEVGNILSMIHQAGMAGSWTRRYEIAGGSNRLLSTSLPGDGETAPYSAEYGYDPHGNMTSMPHLSSIEWDYRDQMQSSNLGGGGMVYYTYDAGGQRARKVWTHGGYRDETIYLGGYEVFRRYQVTGGTETLPVERQTLHVMDGVKRVALVETKTVDTEAGGSFEPSTVIRYQLGNHLGSAVLEVDGEGAVISYEEYHPYGTSAYRSGTGAAEVSRKRYRYTGKEQDDETGLYYHGARYYACWLGRWASADPSGMAADGANLYQYVRASPVQLMDPSGRQSTTNELIAQKTDVELHRHLKSLSPETRAEFIASASGSFKQRAQATLERGKLETIRTGITTVEHVRPQDRSSPGDGIVAQTSQESSPAEVDNEGLSREDVLHAAVKFTGAGEVPNDGALGATIGQILANYLFDDVRPNAQDVGAVARAAATEISAKAAGRGVKTETITRMTPDATLSPKGAGPGGPKGSTGGGPAYRSVYADGTLVVEGQQPPRLPPNAPDPEATGPHSRVRWDEVNDRIYQLREYDAAGNPVKDIDMTSPTYPNGTRRPDHLPPPHQHPFIINDPRGGPRSGFKRGSAEKL
ncbi:MAG: RHS repeat-associated core domain-containing protein [Byssovorax sp.]